MNNKTSDNKSTIRKALNHYLLIIQMDSKYDKNAMESIKESISKYHEYLDSNEPTDEWILSNHLILSPALTFYHKYLDESIRNNDSDVNIDVLRSERKIVIYYKERLKSLI